MWDKYNNNMSNVPKSDILSLNIDICHIQLIPTTFIIRLKISMLFLQPKIEIG